MLLIVDLVNCKSETNQKRFDSIILSLGIVSTKLQLLYLNISKGKERILTDKGYGEIRIGMEEKSCVLPREWSADPTFLTHRESFTRMSSWRKALTDGSCCLYLISAHKVTTQKRQVYSSFTRSRVWDQMAFRTLSLPIAMGNLLVPMPGD